MTPKTAVTLSDIIEPAFLVVCRVNRLLRSRVNISYEKARTDAQGAVERMRRDAQRDAALLRQYELVELPLLAFIDGMMTDMPAPWAGRWASERLAVELRHEVAADEKFFDLLDACMLDTSPEASERLLVFHTCIGLGYVGSHYADRSLLRNRLQQINLRLRRADLVIDRAEMITPEAYKHTDPSSLQVPVSRSVIPIILCFIITLVALGIINVRLYRENADTLSSLLKSIKPVPSTQAVPPSK